MTQKVAVKTACGALEEQGAKRKRHREIPLLFPPLTVWEHLRTANSFQKR